MTKLLKLTHLINEYRMPDMQVRSCRVKACLHNQGFTLLELMLAITLMGIVVVIISSGFRLGINAWEKGEFEAIELQRLRILSGLMSQQIKSAFPYEMKIESEDVLIFRGASDSMLFVTAFKDRYPGGLKWVRYKYKDGILLYKEGILPDKRLLDKVKGDEEELDSGIGEVKFEYMSADDDEWNDSWDFGDTMPGAVRIKLGYFEPFMINIPMSRAEGEEPGDNNTL